MSVIVQWGFGNTSNAAKASTLASVAAVVGAAVLLAAVLVAAGLAGAGCAEPARTVEHTHPLVPSPLFVDGDGNPIDPDRTPDQASLQKVFSGARGAGTTGGLVAPVLAPDGRPVTWGAFRRGSGTVRLDCGAGGTRVTLSVDGLIPDATYSAWVVFFQPPGFRVNGFDDVSGLAPVGPSDGSQSVFRSDSAGRALVDAITPAGTVTVAYVAPSERIAPCLLDALEIQVVAAYHIDGKTCGRFPCSADSRAEQLGWLFERGKVEAPGAP